MRQPKSILSIAWLVLPACYQGLGDAAQGDASSGAADVDGDGGDDSDGADTEDVAPLACAEMPDAADPLRRLTSDELVATVESLVGAPMPGDIRAWLPSDMREETFSNAADALVTLSAHTEALLRIAEWASTSIFLDAPRAARFVGCDPYASTCLRQFIARFGRRAYRRTLTDDEIDRLHALASGTTTPGDPWAPFATVVEAVLQSPKFLLRPEVGTPDANGRVRLAGSEVAGRLAFALWGEAPDDALLDLADAGELDDASGVRAVAEQMLADPRARDGLGTLASQWFLLPKLDLVQVDVNLYPELTPELRAAMRDELDRLIAEHMFGDVDFRELYVSESAQVTPELAELYGVELGPTLRATALEYGTVRIDFTDDDDRGGLLGRAGFLTMGAESWFASPVRRGLNVRTAALCDRPPPPPPDVEMNDIEDAEDPADALEQHSSDPACSGCHQLLDPVGWGLDRYDAIGRRRLVDETGDPVRNDGDVAGVGAFAGARELGELVASAPQTTHCATTRTADWLLARPAGDATACTLAEIETDIAEHGLVYRDLVLTLVTSEPFLTRTMPDEGGT